MLKITFAELSEFKKDFKRLCKKYSSLPRDLEIRKMVLQQFPTGRSHLDVAEIPRLKIKSKIYKARVDCQSLRRDSLRLIYCYDEDLQLITFIELYFKGEQVLEKRQRILQNFE